MMGRPVRSAVQKKLSDSFRDIKKPITKRSTAKKSLLDENFDKDKNAHDVTPIRELSSSFTFHENSSPYLVARKAMHISKPTTLPCREEQIETIQTFITSKLKSKKSGSLYISGAPGTGKTATVTFVLDELENEHKFMKVLINCMNLLSPASIFERILTELKIKTDKNNDLREILLKKVTGTASKTPLILVLDEMDQLLLRSGKGAEILYKLFELTSVPKSRLIIIGIANAMDLTTRHLPLLTSFKDSSCELLQFPPYDKDDICKILTSRLSSVNSSVFDEMGIKFVATKVAASTGDMRKALNACKTAIETMEKQERKVLKTTSDDGFNSSSPRKINPTSSDVISIMTLSNVLAPPRETQKLPLQQQLILATLLRIHKKSSSNQLSSNKLKCNGVNSSVSIGALYDEYRGICDEKGLSFIDKCEVLSIISMLEDRNFCKLDGNANGTPSRKSAGKQKNGPGVFFDPKMAEGALRGTELIGIYADV